MVAARPCACVTGWVLAAPIVVVVRIVVRVLLGGRALVVALGFWLLLGWLLICGLLLCGWLLLRCRLNLSWLHWVCLYLQTSRVCDAFLHEGVFFLRYGFKQEISRKLFIFVACKVSLRGPPLGEA